MCRPGNHCIWSTLWDDRWRRSNLGCRNIRGHLRVRIRVSQSDIWKCCQITFLNVVDQLRSVRLHDSFVIGLFRKNISSYYWWYGGGDSSWRNFQIPTSLPSSQLVSGERASHHQKLAPIFAGIDSCLMVTKRWFSRNGTSVAIWLNERFQHVAKGWLSTYAVGK